MADVDNDRDHLLRILVSTDNHLGVWEKDEIRKDDSFQAFEEVLQLAVEQEVDMLLLGGDLFHDNKPSRPTVVKTIQLLTKYCLGDKPVSFRILSDQASNFVSGRVNYADPNINIGLPVFTIHGNHDDPSGTDNLSAVDILSSCGLINYFGKVPLGGSNIGRITLSPVLVEKGDTKLALYGLGNVRDERLGRLFQTPGCVTWVRPASTPDIPQADWLNLLVVHQNRVQHGAAAKNCLQDRHLPCFLDLVVWGHEHECKPQPELITNANSGEERDTHILQPGSTVATALSEGESKRKHVFFVEALRDKWRSVQVALRSVRPFVWATVALREVPGLTPDDAPGITALLERKVADMVAQARREHQQEGGRGEVLPLVRLRVDYSGFSTINSQRFGQKFVGKVANPHDILLWAKAAARRTAKAEADAAASGEGVLRPDQLDQARIEDLVSQHLHAQLEILPQEDLAAALAKFVDKDEKNALADCVTTALKETQAAAGDDERLGAITADADVANVVNVCVNRRRTSAPLAPKGGETPAPRGGAGGEDGGGLSGLDLGAQPEPSGISALDENQQLPGRMRPPPARGGGGLRQVGLQESLARGAAGGARNGGGATGKGTLDAFLGGGGGAPSLSQLTSQASARRGRGRGRGGARGGGGGSRRGCGGGAAPGSPSGMEDDELMDSGEGEGGEAAAHGSGQRPGKRARGAEVGTPRRTQRQRKQVGSYVDSDDGGGGDSDDADVIVVSGEGSEGEEDEDGIEDDDDSPAVRRRRRPATATAGGGRRRATAQAVGGGRGSGRVGGRALTATASLPVSTPATQPARPGESYIDSDDDHAAAAQQRKPPVAGSGRRRMPASLAASQGRGASVSEATQKYGRSLGTSAR